MGVQGAGCNVIAEGEERTARTWQWIKVEGVIMAFAINWLLPSPIMVFDANDDSILNGVINW